MYTFDQNNELIRYAAIAIELSKKNYDYQKTMQLAKKLAHASDEINLTLIEFKDKETNTIYEAFCKVLQIFASSFSDLDAITLPFVYQDFPIASRLSNPAFIEIRDKAAIALLNMNLSIQQKVGVLTAFQLISQSGLNNEEFATASQLVDFRKHAWEYLTDKFYFEELGFHINEAAKKLMAERNLLILHDYLKNLNAINHAALLAYQKLDEQYAQILANIIQKIKQEFKKAKKKVIRKAVKNFEIGIAAMVATVCMTPYVSAFIGEVAELGVMTGMEALLTSAAIDALTYSAVSTGAEAIFNNDFNRFHKNFLQRAAIAFSTQLTGSLMATHAPAPMAKGSAESIKISGVTAAVKNALQSILRNGKFDDALKATLLGGVTGATTDKLVSIFYSFDITKAMDEVLKAALQDGIHASAKAVLFAVDKKSNHTSNYGYLVDILLTTLASFLAGNIQHGIKNISEKIKEEETPTHPSDAQSLKLSPSQTDHKTQPVSSSNTLQQPVTRSVQSMQLHANQIPSQEKDLQKPQKTQETQKAHIPRGDTQLTVSTIGIGKKPRRGGGLKFFDIADGRYIDKKQFAQKMLDANKTRNISKWGITLAHKFPPKAPRVYWLAQQQFSNENITVRPMVICDEQTYFQMKFNPKTGQFRIDLSTNKNIRLNLASGEYDAGCARLDYAVNDAEACALAKATISTDRGLKASIDVSIGVLGPNVTYSVQSSYQYSVLGLTFSGEISGKTGYGAAIEAGLGLTTDKTQPTIRLYSKLGAFLGFGTQITSNIIVGLNNDLSVFEEVRNSPERKMIDESINGARKRNDEWNPTSFFGKWSKIYMTQGLDELEMERFEIDGNIAAGKLRIAPISRK